MLIGRHLPRPALAVLVCCSLLAAMASPLRADEITWNVDGNGDWHSSSSWVGGVPGAGDTATFDPLPSYVGVVTLSSPASVGNMNVGSPTLFLINGSSLTFDTLDPLQESQWTINPTAFAQVNSNLVLASDLRISTPSGSTMTLTLQGNLSSSGDLTAADGGVLKLLGDNSAWTGQLVVDGARVDVQSSTGLGSTGTGTIVNSGSLWHYTPTGESISLNSGLLGFSGAAFSNAISAATGRIEGTNGSLNSMIDLTGGPLTFKGTGFTFSGDLTGSGDVTLESAGSGLTINGSLLHSGTTSLIGKVNIATTGAGLPNSNLILNSGRQLHLLPGGTQSVQIGQLTLNGGSITKDASLAPEVGIEILDMFTYYSGSVAMPIYGAGGFTKETGSTLTVSTPQYYSGQTIINGGTLIVTHPQALGTSSGLDADATIVNAGATLSLAQLGTLTEKFIINDGTLAITDHATSTTYGETHLASEIEVSGNITFHTSERKVLNIDGVISGDGSIRVVSGTGTGDISTYDGRVRFYGANSYTGQTVVQGILEIYDPLGLGDPSAGTQVVNGFLALKNSGSSEPITVESAGVLILDSAPTPHFNPVTLRGSRLETDSIYYGNAVLQSTLVLDAGGEIGRTGGPANLEITGGITGSGSLLILPDEVIVRDNVDFDGSLYLQFAVGGLYITDDLSIAGDVSIRSGYLHLEQEGGVFENRIAAEGPDPGHINIEANYTLGTVVLDPRGFSYTSRLSPGYSVSVTPGKQLTITDELIWLGGTLAGTITGQDTLYKHRGHNAGIVDPAGSGYHTVIVEDDTLTVSGNLGAIHPDFILSPHTYASLVLVDTGQYTGDIQLNNVHSAIALEVTGTSVAAGNIYLGDQGAVIGDADISGQIHGGTLYKSAGDVITLRSSGHTYSGPTSVATQGSFVLVDQGQLTTTSTIQIEGDASLLLDNRGAAVLADRVADTIPVQVQTGIVALYGASGLSVTETLGQFSAVGGLARIRVENDVAPGSQTTLLLDSFQRDPSATVLFETLNSGAEIHFASAPTLTNGLIGGWAMFGPNDFASYGPDGVVAYSSMFTPATDLNSSNSTDVVSLTSQEPILAADRTVSGLILRNSDIDLNGRTLTIGSGGIIAHTDSGNTLSGGSVTTSGTEIYLQSGGNGGVLLDAAIVDGPGGPVSLVMSGPAGFFTLNADNTYSGDTFVNGAQAYLEKATVLPAGTNLRIRDGFVSFEYTPATDGNGDFIPLQLGNLEITDGGAIRGNAAVEALTYEVEEGFTQVEFVGNGSLTKTGRGTYTLYRENPRWTGPIHVEEGTLAVERWDALGIAPLDDAHAISIAAGALLTINADIDGRKAILEGGELWLDRGASFLGPIEIRESSTIRAERSSLLAGNFSGAGDLTIVGPTGYETTVSGSLNDFQGDLFIAGGHTTIADGNTGYSGQVSVSARELEPLGNSALGTGPITMLTESVLTLPTNLTNEVHLQGGGLRFIGNGITLSGPLTVSGNSYIYIRDGYHNGTIPGTATLNGTVTLADQSSLHFAPDLKPTDYANFGVKRSASINANLQINGEASLISYDSTVSVQGVVIAGSSNAQLHLNGGGGFQMNVSVDLPSGTGFTLYRNGAPQTLTISGKDLQGNGTLHSDLLVTSGGNLSPGDATNTAGLFTVNGNATFNLDGRYRVQLGGILRGTGYDALDISDNLSIDNGLLILSLINGFKPITGDEFRIASASAVSGVFSNAPSTVSAGGYQFAVDYQSDGIVLSPILGPAPKLVYDPTTGNLQLDANGLNVTSFTLGSSGAFLSPADFSDLDADVGFTSPLITNTANEISWISALVALSTGFNGPGLADLGNILPTGLDRTDLRLLLTTNTWGSPGLSGGFELSVSSLLFDPADTDKDGDVDTADITTSLQNFTGAIGALGGKTMMDGDTDMDGDVDTADLTTSFQNFTGTQAATVPEPSTLPLLLLGLAGLMGLTLWHRKRNERRCS